MGQGIFGRNFPTRKDRNRRKGNLILPNPESRFIYGSTFTLTKALYYCAEIPTTLSSNLPVYSYLRGQIHDIENERVFYVFTPLHDDQNRKNYGVLRLFGEDENGLDLVGITGSEGLEIGEFMTRENVRFIKAFSKANEDRYQRVLHAVQHTDLRTYGSVRENHRKR